MLTYRISTALTMTDVNPFPPNPDTHEFQSFGIPGNNTATLPKQSPWTVTAIGECFQNKPSGIFLQQFNRGSPQEFEEPYPIVIFGRKIINRAMNQTKKD